MSALIRRYSVTFLYLTSNVNKIHAFY